MKWNRWARQTHRWLAILFTMAVIVNVLLNVLPVADPELVTTVGLLTLLPLAALLATGLYLFVLPYISSDARPRNES